MIEVSKLTKSFGPVLAVDDISFEVPARTVVGFLGANGAGKTTTLRMLAGLLTPTSGTARIGGFDCLSESLEVCKILGYMPEQVALYNEMRLGEFLEYAAVMRGVESRRRKSAVEAALDHCQLTDMRRRLVGTLSKGYRQRVGLAQALVADPKVVILDEPTIGLDPVQIRETREMIRRLAENCTVLLSTHILSEVEQICSKVLIISGGRLLADDWLENLAKGGEWLAMSLSAKGPGEDIERVLKALPGVESVKAKQRTGELCKFELRMTRGAEAEGAQEAVGRSLVKNGWPVMELRSREPMLEDIYIRITESERVV